LKDSVTKPVATAGFFIFTVLISLSGPVRSQGYIDLEAEREAARQQAGAAQNAGVEVYTAEGGSSGLAPVADGGIQPYSGQTTTVVPIADDDAVMDEPGANAGALVIQLQQLQEEVRRLNGIVEQQSAEIGRLKEQSLERYIDLDRRLADLAAGAGPAPGADEGAGFTFGGASATGATDPGGAVPGQVVAEPGEEPAYQAAYNYVKARNFPEAVEAFQKFLARFPLGAYAPNAHYWLGELYLVITPPEPELARQSFKLLLDQYPDNPKVPDALYKLGKVHFLKGNRERSRAYLDQVIVEYPGHPAAQLARDFLDENF
jgi:tol-pal system protein YbgF